MKIPIVKRLLLNATSALAFSYLNTAVIAGGHEDDLWTVAFVAIGGGLQSFSAEGDPYGLVDGEYYKPNSENSISFSSDDYFGDSTFLGEESFATAEVAYDVQVGENYALGVVAGFNSSGGSSSASIDTTWVSEGGNGGDEPAIAANLAIFSVTHLSGRAGFLINPHTLSFGTASTVRGTGQMSFTGTLSDFFEDASLPLFAMILVIFLSFITPVPVAMMDQ